MAFGEGKSGNGPCWWRWKRETFPESTRRNAGLWRRERWISLTIATSTPGRTTILRVWRCIGSSWPACRARRSGWAGWSGCGAGVDRPAMSWKSTWVLLTLAAALVAFSVFVEHPMREERARQASRFVLPALDPRSVTNVSLTLLGQSTIDVGRSAPGAHDWRLTRPVTYPADAGRIEALLQALSELEWQDRIAASELAKRPDAPDAYGLSHPQIALQLQSATGPRALDIGNISALGDQMFLRVAGGYDIYKIGVALTNVIPLNKDFWRDSSLVDLAALKFNAIHVRSAEKTFDLTLDAMTGLWQMAKPVAARADTARIEQLLKALGQLR